MRLGIFICSSLMIEISCFDFSFQFHPFEFIYVSNTF